MRSMVEALAARKAWVMAFWFWKWSLMLSEWGIAPNCMMSKAQWVEAMKIMSTNSLFFML